MMDVCNKTATTLLADAIMGFDSSTLRSCPFCGFKTAELVLFDDEGYLIVEETWDNECGDAVRRNEEGDPNREDLIKWAQINQELYVDHCGIECSKCGAMVFGRSPELAKERWNRRAYNIAEWRSAFAPSGVIE